MLMADSPLKNKNFCPIPFIQLQLTPRGVVSACCFTNEFPVGNINQNSLAEIWNGEVLQKWRQEFIDNDIQICKKAIETFGCQKLYRHLDKHVELEKVQKSMPKRLDVRLNGQCNLECIMCDVWTFPNGLYDQSDLWTSGPEKIFPFLVEIDVLGGEPLIQKDTYKLIDQVSAVNRDCTWSFVSNGQYKFNEKIKSSLDKIKIRHFHISMDAITPATYSEIRKKGQFDKSLNTLLDIVKYRNDRAAKTGENFLVFSSFCVMRQNFFEIIEFHDFCRSNGVIPTFQILSEYDFASPFSIGSFQGDEKIKATEYLKTALEKIGPDSTLEHIKSQLSL